MELNRSLGKCSYGPPALRPCCTGAAAQSCPQFGKRAREVRRDDGHISRGWQPICKAYRWVCVCEGGWKRGVGLWFRCGCGCVRGDGNGGGLWRGCGCVEGWVIESSGEPAKSYVCEDP
eukprot:1138656-Pelagomonas_calceolata.AAC.7